MAPLKRIRSMIHFFRFHTAHTRSRTHIEKWQLNQLKKMIRYFEKNIALFREIMASRGIRAEDIQSLADVGRFPIMNKQTFIGRPIEEYTDVSQPLRGMWVTTSGTSGTLFSPLRRAVAETPLYRDSLRYRTFMDAKPWRMDAEWMRMVHIRVLPLVRRNTLVIFAHDLLASPQAPLHDIAVFAPDIIEGHSSLLFELARAARAEGIRIRPRAAVSASERLLPEVRRFVEEEFQCPVFDRYGLEEFGTVGMECAQHDGFHINAESLIVEVVDDAGTPLPDGMQGRILITDLYNFEMPFVRYDTGDYGRMDREECACGLETPRVWLTGRHSAFLTFPTRRFHQFEFSEILQTFTPYIFHYHIVKTSNTAIAVRVVPTDACTPHICEELRTATARLVGPTISASVEIVASIPRLPRGKSQIVSDETALS